ncbi:helix-turn-helix domain containing protein [Nocardioides sp. BP30]|uniref:TetR/AcrR family transcriptional regulator n=1 Tax=Nocardioides sp. BP30 TaxID=3036374 RepID=UPI0024688276|nr:helix-turn-helix domain-containing protein [Nocardioides sp. BP30]WGL51339.1 helix-turn-helix domain containing protein [Nocardioides sp. BP30]
MSAGRTDIADVAFHLFAERGYDATSVDDIAAAAGVSRSTFFRSYGSKEAVIFPDHDALLQRVEDRLRSSHSDSALAAVVDAVKIVLFHYVAEGERARERYRLTSSVTALRERELWGGLRYQRLFRTYLGRWGDGSEAAELNAELMAASVVAAHNRVLRRWLRGEIEDPQREIESALAVVQRTFSPSDAAGGAVVVVSTAAPLARIEAAVRQALAQEGG